jgi:hypothetical protein
MKYIYKHLMNFAAIVLLFAIFSGCTTSLFQSPKSQIVGTWESDPIIAGNTPDTWSFNSNGTCTLSFHVANTGDSTITTGAEIYSPAYHYDKDTTLTNVPYSISGSSTYYLTIDAYAEALGYSANQFRFMIVTLNSKTMYLEGQTLFNPVQTGYIQVSLSKQ